MLRALKYCVLGLLLSLTACVEPYAPPVISSPARYLVVDGFINLSGVTVIRLSRSQSLALTTAPPFEAKAMVSIKDDAGALYPLAERLPGTYSSQPLALSPNRRYQLQVSTLTGRRYASDLVVAKVAPPIDSVTWSVDSKGVQLYVSTHDPANATRYYRWKAQETWQYNSAFRSDYEYVNGAMRPRVENIFTCWSTANSTSIMLGNTQKLSDDVVANAPLHLLPRNSYKLRVKYSLLVQQLAQTAEEYAYWEMLQKNTESLGTLFDPLPTQLTGNVHCLDDAGELVLGYVGATSVTQKRMFIDRSQLPLGTKYATGYEDCIYQDTIPLRLVNDVFRNPVNVPTYALLDGNFNPVFYLSSSPDCVDCRRRGTNVKPSFWP
ncbi:DUF4249 domain-containing protein [Hymenobacter sp. 5317J-9]|uniref:DUF4249 domain-containing protein n=1 Tax=Hymenobacter sp. 5317J-9 TaxID=2932250 RepID=UPI001FD6BA98|nr:DUF4249 domain-containing protein [Hymenobacter sp. 5317J-9]UOQ98632.1 DUF4249 domain-containing protein [Hymenobacter sp. 5317J-9]